MTLNEYIKQNGEKPIEIQEDGTIKVLEENGPFKPKHGERYYIVSDIGNVLDLYWDGDGMDRQRMDIGDLFRTKAEANRALHRLKARKKFLDAGGHEGMDGYLLGVRYHAYPQRGDKTLMIAKEGSVTAFDIWFETEDACQKAIDSLTDDEKAALCWTGDGE